MVSRQSLGNRDNTPGATNALLYTKLEAGASPLNTL